MQVTGQPLLGRDRELARLRDAVSAARAGTPAFVLLTGEAGIGKTRLLRSLADEAAASGMRVLWGTAIEAGQGIPYLPLVGPAGGALRDAEEATRTVRPGPGARAHGSAGAPAPDSSLRVLRGAFHAGSLEGGRRASGHASPDLTTARLVDALFDVFTRVPTLLVVDDVHWADASTVAVLDYLAHRAAGIPLAVVVAARDEVPGAIERLAIGDGRQYARLPIARLSREDVRRQATALLGVGVGSAQAADLYRRTAGNPFFVEQLLARGAGGSAAADPAGDPESLARQPVQPIPASLRALLLRRLVDASSSSRRVLEALAAIGRPASLDELAEVGDLAPPVVRVGMEDTLAAGITVPDEGGVAFCHPLFGEVLEAELDGPGRRALHARAARLTARLGAPAAVVAEHWWRAGDESRTWSSALPAAREAMATFAFAEALLHLERALDAWPPDAPGRVDALLDAARAAWQIGEPTRALALAQEARALGPGRAEIAVAIGSYAWDAGRRAEAAEAFAAATSLLTPDSPPLVRARATWGMGRAAVASGDPASAVALGLEASREAREAGDLVLASEGLALAAMGRAFAGSLDGTPWLDDAVRLALQSGAPFCTGHAFQFLVDLRGLGGDEDAALEAAMRGIDACTRLGIARTHGSDLRGRAALLLTAMGRYEAADAILRPADPRAFTALATGILSMRRGAFMEAATALDLAAAGGAIGGPGALGGWLELARVELAWLEGDPAVGDLLARVPPVPGAWGADVRAWAARWHARVEGGTDALAETASMHPDPRRAAALRAEVEATVTGPDGPLAVDAADRWARAASTWTAAGRPWEAAWAGLAEAEACFAARDTARGRAALAGVVSVADELGAHPLRTHADTLARRARLRSVEPAPRRSDPDLPTPREHDVLVLMADGLTNPQIAQRLFLSPKTVGIHVSRLLAKLDAHTRGEAVAVARRRGLLD